RVRNATFHVLEPRGVRLGIRHEHDFRPRTGDLDDALGEVEYRDLLPRIADVVEATRRVGVLAELHECAHDVGDVAEATTLFAVTVHRHGRAGHRLLDEPRDDHAIVSRLPWTDSIEQPHGNHRQAELAVVREPE